jgi:hypothetical protein
MKSLISEGLHYIRRGDSVEEMFHLDTDPLERMDVVLYPRYFDALERLRARLEAITRKR